MQFENLVDNTDFNTLLKDLATIETWIPKTTEIQSNNQRPTDSCFGGKCSIHPEEQIDPNGYKFSFQFKAPNENTFYRVFLATNDNNTPEAAKIFPIEASKCPRTTMASKFNDGVGSTSYGMVAHPTDDSIIYYSNY